MLRKLHIHRYKAVAGTWVWEYQECSCGKRRVHRLSQSFDHEVNWRWVYHQTNEVFPNGPFSPSTELTIAKRNHVWDREHQINVAFHFRPLKSWRRTHDPSKKYGDPQG